MSEYEIKDGAAPESSQANERKWLLPLLVSVCLSFTVCVYAPLETYFATAKEQWFNAADIVPVSLLAFVLLAAALFGIGMLLRGRARSVFCGLLVGLSLAFYVQAGFANADYGIFDGIAIDWSSFGSYPIWNTLMWAVFIIVPVVLCAALYKRTNGVIRFASVLLVLAQLASVTTLGLSAEKKQNDMMPTFTNEGMLDISKNRNVIMFVADTFDTTSFSDMLKEYPETADRLQGFTWFKNMVGQYTVTNFAIPLLMTGESYLYEDYESSFLSETWERETFFHSLKNEGYSIGLYTEGRYACAAQEGIVDNELAQKTKPSSLFALWGEMMRLTAFRYLPHVLKPEFERAGIGFDGMKQAADRPIYRYENEVLFGALRSQGLNVEKTEPCFKMYHIYGMHRPFSLFAERNNDENVTSNEQANMIVNTICDYIDIMKEQGVYDSSMIIITSDHGLKHSDVRPVMLIKRPGDSGELNESIALVTQSDLHLTIAEAMNLREKPNYGEDMFSADPDAMRTVPFYSSYNIGDVLYEYDVYLDDEYCVYYEPTYAAYSLRNAFETERYEYGLGTRVDFAKAEDLLPWLDEMSYWDVKNIKGHPYIGRPDTTFAMYIADEEYEDLRVTLYLDDVEGEALPYKVLVKGEIIDEGTVTEGDREMSFTVPYDYCYDYELMFTLRFPDAKSEYEKNGWKDGSTSVLAVSLSGMLIENISEE